MRRDGRNAAVGSDRKAVFPVLIFLCGWLAGCGGSKPVSLAIKPNGPLSVHRGNAPTRVFSGEEETPTTSYAFEGATGSVRVSMEVVTLAQPNSATPVSLNDVCSRRSGTAGFR